MSERQSNYQEAMVNALIEALEGFMRRAREIKGAYIEMKKEGLVPTETGTATIWERDGKAYCRVADKASKLTIFPMPSLQIKPDSVPIRNFLEPRILERMKQKHGVNYRLETRQGILYAIVLEGDNLTDKLKDELKNPLIWALEKSVS